MTMEYRSKGWDGAPMSGGGRGKGGHKGDYKRDRDMGGKGAPAPQEYHAVPPPAPVAETGAEKMRQVMEQQKQQELASVQDKEERLRQKIAELDRKQETAAQNIQMHPDELELKRLREARAEEDAKEEEFQRRWAEQRDLRKQWRSIQFRQRKAAIEEIKRRQVFLAGPTAARHPVPSTSAAPATRSAKQSYQAPAQGARAASGAHR